MNNVALPEAVVLLFILVLLVAVPVLLVVVLGWLVYRLIAGQQTFPPIHRRTGRLQERTMNKVVHFEIPADNLERAKTFYRQTFGWQIQDWPMADGNVYAGVRTVEVDESTFLPREPGAINGGIVQRDSVSTTPQVTVNVSSIDEAVNKVTAAGGRVLKGRTAIENMGYYAYVADTEGNLLGLWEDVKK